MSIIDTLAQSISIKNRKRKFSFFQKHLHPQAHETILDVGVTNEEFSPGDNYLEKAYPLPEKITALSIKPLDLFRSHYPQVQAVEFSGQIFPFSDNAFDIAYSNAVIEHVGNEEKQIIFMKELYRVARRGYLTTPNRFFPIEVHTRVPFLHLIFSKEIFDRFLTFIGKKWATGNYMNLLSEKEIIALFKDAGIQHYAIKKNRFLGFPMTFTILWKKM